MKYLVLMLGLCLTVPAFAEEEYLALDSKELRLDVLFDNEAGTEGDPGIGFELGFGTALYPLDIVSLNVGHEDNDDDDLTTISIMAEEHYPIGLPLVPYAGLGIGYGWAGIDGRQDEEAIIFKADLGVKYRLTEKLALSASVEFSWADSEIYTKDRTIEDKNLEFGVGLRFYF